MRPDPHDRWSRDRLLTNRVPVRTNLIRHARLPVERRFALLLRHFGHASERAGCLNYDKALPHGSRLEFGADFDRAGRWT
jgi:hypothetical protein